MANFKKLDESFECLNCGEQIEKLGYTSRNHCPHCLYSLHVDILPGDRLNPCRGLQEPIAIEHNKKGIVIIYRCKKCGSITRNIMAEDDDYNQILKVSKNPQKY